MALGKMESSDLSIELKVALNSAPWRKSKRSQMRDGQSTTPSSSLSASPSSEKGNRKSVRFEIPCEEIDSCENDATSVPCKDDAAQQLDQWYVQVSISNMPLRLLIDATVRVMLHQVVSENSLISFTIDGGVNSGNVTAFFSTVQDAQYCVNHFNGRRWERQGMPVLAQIVSMPWAPAVAPLPSPLEAEIAKLLEMAAMHEMMSQTYAAQAAHTPEPAWSESPAKVLTPCKIPTLDSEQALSLTAMSPAFICITESARSAFGSCSDISTESGESENEQNTQSDTDEETVSVS